MLKGIEFNGNIELLLRMYLQEDEYPLFSTDELKLLYESNDKSIAKTCWRACLLKGSTDEKVKVGPIEVVTKDKDYWLQLANMYEKEYKRELEQEMIESGKSKYITLMGRYDSQ